MTLIEAVIPLLFATSDYRKNKMDLIALDYNHLCLLPTLKKIAVEYTEEEHPEHVKR